MYIVFTIVVIDLIGFGIIIPLLPFFGEHFGAAPHTVGFLMATYSAGQLVAAPFWGRLSDTVGRKPVLLTSLLGMSFAYVLMSFSESLIILFLSRAISGLMAGNISAALAYVADITTPQDRAKGMGLVGAGFGIGFIIGPAIGGLLAGSDPNNANYQTPALVAAGASFLAFTVCLFFLRESLDQTHRSKLKKLSSNDRLNMLRETLLQPNVRLLLLISFVVTLVFASLESIFPIWSRRTFNWGPQQNGYLFAIVGIISVLIQGGCLGSLNKKFGEIRLIIGGMLLLAAGMALIPFSLTFKTIIPAMAISAIGFSIVSPSLNTAISIRIAETEQGGAMGAARSVTTSSRMIGPALAGIIFGSLGKDWPFFISALLMLVLVAIALRFFAAGILSK